MKNEFKFTMNEVKEQLTLAVGEAFAGLAKKMKSKSFVTRSVKMNKFLGTTENNLIPDKLDYITEEDYIYARFDYEGKYEIVYNAVDGLTFSVADESYSILVERFINYFLNIYRA